ncbi:DUF362 domain-containing protein [Candidatus Aerophobetes bacterium]|nr:DUF362 domain-containing protein [Candidatus Aerophobetes bacterium]
MSEVSIVRCESYLQEEVDRAVKESVKLIGGLEGIIHKGDRVLLKVNMLNADPPEKAVTTHPAVVRAVVKLVKEVGGVPFLGEASGIAYRYEEAKKAWEITGFKEVAEEEDVEIVNFQQIKEIDNSKNRKVPLLHIAKEVIDADVIVTLPKLKTHSFALFTGAIKNLYGTIPGFRKKELHAIAPTPGEFAELMADILTAVYPELAIMDAIVGMEGNGPAAGSPRKIGLVLASRDPVAIDAVASSIIGCDPLDVDIIRVASERGLGVAELDKIKIKGTDLNEVKVEDFELVHNVNTLLKKMPSFVLFIGKLLAPYLIKVEPQIDLEKCGGCMVCTKHCPVEAIKMASDYPKIDRKKCIKCFCCQEFCPQKAVQIKYNWLARKLKV